MDGRLIIDGNAVYEIDEECERFKSMMAALEEQPGNDRQPAADTPKESVEQKK